jgi:acyl carrier protein
VDSTDVSAWAPATVPIGQPLANVTAHVLDRHGALVSVGIPGELWIGGAGVARGYVGDAARTAERFVTINGERCYRTGDRVRRLPTGDLEFLGRLDTQVKVRGHRVELAEIEAVLRRHPAVRQAVVTLDGDALVGYLVAEWSSDNDLAQHVAMALPDYMVPAAWVRLERIPVTANGKVDRAALPAPQRAPAAVADDGAPRSETEGRLAVIWAEVLKRDRVGRQENFFALGGNSLLAIRLLGRVSKQFGVRLALRALFEHPTVAGMAVALQPAHPLEAPLTTIWAEVMKRPEVGTEENFFAIGGNSLLAIRLLGRISKAFGVRLSLRLLFEHPTIAQLAPAIEAARQGGEAAP